MPNIQRQIIPEFLAATAKARSPLLFSLALTQNDQKQMVSRSFLQVFFFLGKHLLCKYCDEQYRWSWFALAWLYQTLSFRLEMKIRLVFLFLCIQRGLNNLRSRRRCWSRRVPTILVKARNSSRNFRSWQRCTKRMNSNYTGLDQSTEAHKLHHKTQTSSSTQCLCTLQWC